MKNSWTAEDQMKFESDVRDSFLASAAYFNSDDIYFRIKCDESTEEVDFDEFCDPLFERFQVLELE